MKQVLQYSGGICSFWSGVRAIEQHGHDNVIWLFADVLMEDKDLYRFNADVERVLGVKITRLCEGRNPWQVFRDEHMIGNTRADMCSRILKRELLKKHIFDNYRPTDHAILFGMDFTEANRLENMAQIYSPFEVWAPMTMAPLWDKCQMQKRIKSHYGIEPPDLYKEGFPHNNCGGFCVKAGQAHFAHLLKVRPDTYAYHEREEQAMRDFLGKDVAILRDRRGGVTKPLTLAAFRARVASGEFEKHEWGGCGCATS